MTAGDRNVRDRPPHRLVATIGFAAAHAVLFTLSYPNAGIWPLAFISLAPLAWCAMRAATTYRAVASIFFTQLLMWTWLHWWMLDVTLLGHPAFCLYMSIWPALAGWLIRRAARAPALRAWPFTIILPIIWVGVECFRGEFLFHGYPWFLLGHPLIEFLPFAQSADLFGTYFVGFLAAGASGLVIDGLRARCGQMPRRRLAMTAAALGLALVANIVYGAFRMGQGGRTSPGPRLLVIQTNLPQSNKIAWDTDQRIEDLERFLDQTTRAYTAAMESGDMPGVIVWPETMFPGFGFEMDAMARIALVSLFADELTMRQQATGIPWLVGSPSYVGLRFDDDGEVVWDRHFNSAYLVHGGLPYQRYDKYFLTPFGETMPYISAWPWLEQRLLSLGASGMSFNLDASPEPRAIRLNFGDGDVLVATPICFEDTVARVCRRMVHAGGEKTVDAFVGLSNDGWFGDHDSGRAQHAQIARFRCIENRVPMVRAANTGFSISVDTSGKVVGSIGPGRYGQARQAGTLMATLNLDSRRTLYSRIGEAWAWGCLVAVAAACLSPLVRRSK